MGIKVKLNNVRLSFPDIWHARVQGNEGEGEPKFAATFIIDPENACVKTLDSVCAAVSKEKWATKADSMLPKLIAEGRVCLHKTPRTNSSGDVYEGYEGMYWLGANSKRRPMILNRDKSPLTEQDSVIYGGCFVDAIVEVFAHFHPKGGNRVLAELKAIRFLRGGDAFGGGAPVSADEFEDIGEDDNSDLV